MRWLFLSLAFLYFWTTPGQSLPSLGFSSSFVPTWEGLELGTQRIVALALMLLGAQLLLQSTSRTELLRALHWLALPLDLLPGLRERFALRMVLTVEAIANAQLTVAKARDRTGFGAQRSSARWGILVGDIFAQTLTAADQQPLVATVLERYPGPPLKQWLLLLTTTTVLFAL